jgi:AcrR family transcriptional regulator
VARRTPDPARRSERARQAILQSAFDLCLERGYEKTTVEAIAERAGVGKQTIYRWWPSKGAVVIDGFNYATGRHIDVPDTGDVVSDLREQMTAVSGWLASPDFGPAYRGVIAAAQSDPELAKILAREIVEPRVAACIERLESARERGEIRADADLDVIVELLYGPLYHRFLLGMRPPDSEQVTTVLELAFAGLRAQKRRSTKRAA